MLKGKDTKIQKTEAFHHAIIDPRPGRINVGRWNERSALHLMCDAE